MDPFILKLILSFICGGASVAILSILAEKYEKVGGAIIGLPTTLAVSTFFIAWTQSIQAVIEATNVIPISLGIMLLFIFFYIFLAQRIKAKKEKSIIICAVLSIIFWFIFSLPLIKINISFLHSVIGFFIIFLFGLYITKLMKIDKKEINREKVKIGGRQLFIRSVFSGFIILVAVFLSKVLGPTWGGIFSVFPSAYLSSLIILHYYRGPKFLTIIGNTAHLGSLILCIYAILVRYLYPTFDFVIGTFVSYFIVTLILLVIWRLKK